MTRWTCVVSIALAGWATGCSCGDDDDDPAGRLAELNRVGSEGGTFTLGALVGVVPEGAVEGGGSVTISGAIVDDVPPPEGSIGPVYQLELDREIREPITLELPYDVADLGGRSALALRVASSLDGIVWDCDPATAPREQSSSVLAVVSHLSFWTLRFETCEGDADCNAPERCIDPGPNGVCGMPCVTDGDCPDPTFCFCGICSRASCEGPAGADCPAGTDCSVAEADQRGVCLPSCTPLDRCGDPEEQQLCSPGGRCAFQASALCPDLFACDGGDLCLHQWCVPADSGCACGVDPGCACEPPGDECPGVDREVCDGGDDEDGDGDIDCADLDCADDPVCTAGLEDCDNGDDDDGDGDADCADLDCVLDPLCSGGDDEICDNGSDDDGDGDTDCSDADCNADPACASGPWPLQITVWGFRTAHALTPENADWFVFQDGDGPWTEVTGVNGVYEPPDVTDPDGRYSIAWECNNTTTTVSVLRAVATEGGDIDVRGCVWTDPGPTTSVMPSVVGDICSELNIYNQTWGAGCGGDFAVDVPQGTSDIFAAEIGGLRGYLERDVEIAGDNMFVSMDYDGPFGFELVEHTRTNEFQSVAFKSKNGSGLAFGFGSPDLTYRGVPAAAQVEGEGHTAFVASDALTAIELVYFKEPIDLDYVGPEVPTPGVTGVRAAEEPYTLYAVDLDEVPAGAEGYILNLSGPAANWSLQTTTAWMDGATRIEVPDLSTADGWQAGFGTDPGASGSLQQFSPLDGLAVECWSAEANRGYAPEGLRCPFTQAVITF